ncbi:MAG: VanZ family protein [Bdellovibrionales bacterium]|nr:VanZ family protein [Bdellovibrionales bacterium]
MSASPQRSLLKLLLSVAIAVITMLLVPFGRPLQRTLQPELVVFQFSTVLAVIGLATAIWYLRHTLLLWGCQKALFHGAALIFFLSSFALLQSATIEFAHLLLYGGFTFSAASYLSTKGSQGRNFINSQLLNLGLAVFDEFLQWIHPERVFDLRDICLNSIAGVVGYLLYMPFEPRR